MDLPKKVLGIDVKHGFAPTYEVNLDKEHVVTQLQKAASTADAVYLAGDPDREGEAICAHLAELLSGPKLEFLTEEQKPEETNGNGKKSKKKSKKPPKMVRKAVGKGKPIIARKNIFRVMFNEITSKAIKAAFEQPGDINDNLVDAQQARRVLDRLVGYKISPIAVGQGAPRTFRWPRTDGRAAPDCRARDGDSRIHPGGILDHTRQSGRRRAAAFEAKLTNSRAKTLRFTRRPKRRRDRGRGPRSAMESRRRHAKGKAPIRLLPSRPPSYNKPPTTDCAIRRNAPWASRSGCTKEWNSARKDRSR